MHGFVPGTKSSSLANCAVANDGMAKTSQGCGAASNSDAEGALGWELGEKAVMETGLIGKRPLVLEKTWWRRGTRCYCCICVPCIGTRPASRQESLAGYSWVLSYLCVDRIVAGDDNSMRMVPPAAPYIVGQQIKAELHPHEKWTDPCYPPSCLSCLLHSKQRTNKSSGHVHFVSSVGCG